MSTSRKKAPAKAQLLKKTSTASRDGLAENILIKAAPLFDRMGFGQTSLQDIADAVGISRPSLYNYFRSKEEILATIVERSTARLDEITTEIRSLEGPAITRLSALIRRLGRSMKTNPTGQRLMLSEAASLPPKLQQRSDRSRRVTYELLVEILAEGVEAGFFRPMDVKLNAGVIIRALGGLQYRDIGDVSMEPDNAAELLEEMLLSGIRQPMDRQVTSAHQALVLLHHDLELLEHHLGSADRKDEEEPQHRR